MQYVTAIERKGIEQGIEQGVEQGIIQSTRENILEVLALRFQEIPDELAGQLDEIDDVAWLKELLKLAVTAPSLEAFTRNL